METIEINTIEYKNVIIAEVQLNDSKITTVQDALDIMANCSSKGAQKMILYKNNLTQDFFNLKTGFAGELLQKFSTYRVQLAIIGDFSMYTSKSLHDFIYESNKYQQVNFVPSLKEAIKKLAQN